jgi:hypothetical protein
VDENRFLSVACEPEERVVFDRQETKYHLLRDAAARLWDEIGEGGSFDLASVVSETEDPIAQLVEAGLISVEPGQAAVRGISRRVWLTRTGKASAAAVVLPLVATIATPRFALGQVGGPSLEEIVDQGTNEPIDEQLDSNFRSFERRQRRRERWQSNNNTDDIVGSTDGTTDGATTETPSLDELKAERKANRRSRREQNQDG